MWNATARVGRSRLLATDADQAAAFLQTAGPWALLPGAGHAFTVPDSPAAIGRLICLVGTPAPGVAGGILEVVAETPGQLVRVRSRTTNPVGKLAVTLAVGPHRGRLRMRLDLEAGCLRPEQTFVEARWRRRLGSWLAAMADTLEGRTAWPGQEMPAALQNAWRDWAVLDDYQIIDVERVVRAAPRAVWQAIRSPVTQRAPMAAAFSGYVPGTPQRQAGEMIYQLLPLPGDQLVAGIYLVVDMTKEQSVLTFRVGRPRTATLTSLEPVASGTKVTLTGRVPRGSSGEVQERVAASLRSRMDAYERVPDSSA
jgi:hypothetical protein